MSEGAPRINRESQHLYTSGELKDVKVDQTMKVALNKLQEAKPKDRLIIAQKNVYELLDTPNEIGLKCLAVYLGSVKPENRQFILNNLFLAAASKNNQEIANKLLQMGADINAVNERGETALHLCCVQSCLTHDLETSETEMVKFLLNKGIDRHALDSSGNSALAVASRCPGTYQWKGDIARIKLLMDSGLSPFQENYEGRIAIDDMKRYGLDNFFLWETPEDYCLAMLISKKFQPGSLEKEISEWSNVDITKVLERAVAMPRMLKSLMNNEPALLNKYIKPNRLYELASPSLKEQLSIFEKELDDSIQKEKKHKLYDINYSPGDYKAEIEQIKGAIKTTKDLLLKLEKGREQKVYSAKDQVSNLTSTEKTNALNTEIDIKGKKMFPMEFFFWINENYISQGKNAPKKYIAMINPVTIALCMQKPECRAIILDCLTSLSIEQRQMVIPQLSKQECIDQYMKLEGHPNTREAILMYSSPETQRAIKQELSK